jgi:hypothetical protein
MGMLIPTAPFYLTAQVLLYITQLLKITNQNEIRPFFLERPFCAADNLQEHCLRLRSFSMQDREINSAEEKRKL